MRHRAQALLSGYRVTGADRRLSRCQAEKENNNTSTWLHNSETMNAGGLFDPTRAGSSY